MFDEEAPNHAEYAYDKKPDKRLRLFRFLLVAGYVLFVTLFFIGCYASRLIALFALCPLFLWIIIYFTWRYVKYDILYRFESGKMTFFRVLGSNNRRKQIEMFSLRVSGAEYVGRDEAEARRSAAGSAKICDLSSSKDADALWIVARNEKGKKIAVRFDVIPRVEKMVALFAKSN